LDCAANRELGSWHRYDARFPRSSGSHTHWNRKRHRLNNQRRVGDHCESCEECGGPGRSGDLCDSDWVSLPSFSLHRGGKGTSYQLTKTLPRPEREPPEKMNSEHVAPAMPPAARTVPTDNGRGEVSLARVYLPFAMVVTFGAFLVVAGYTAGATMSGIARDKAEMEARLGAIEKEVTAIKNILSDRASSANCTFRPKQ
jgi:hypothetical protein